MELITVQLDHVDSHPNEPAARLADVTDLAASIAEIGVIHAPRLVRNGERFITVVGHRRVEACKSLGWTEIDAVVAEDWSELSQLEALLAENILPKPFTGTQEAGIMQTVLQTGAEPVQISRAIGRSPEMVEAAPKGLAIVADMDGNEAMTLDELAVISRFEDDPKAVKKLMAEVGRNSFDWKAKEIAAARERSERKRALTAELKDKGLRIIPMPNYMSGAPQRLTYLSIKPEDHAECPGHCVFINFDATGVEYACDHPELHGREPVSTGPDPKTEADTEARKAAWELATAHRRDWVVAHLKGIANESAVVAAIAQTAWDGGLGSGRNGADRFLPSGTITPLMRLCALWVAGNEGDDQWRGILSQAKHVGYVDGEQAIRDEEERAAYISLLERVGYDPTEPELVFLANVDAMTARDVALTKLEDAARAEGCTACMSQEFCATKDDAENDDCGWEWDEEAYEAAAKKVETDLPLLPGAVAADDEIAEALPPVAHQVEWQARGKGIHHGKVTSLDKRSSTKSVEVMIVEDAADPGKYQVFVQGNDHGIFTGDWTSAAARLTAEREALTMMGVLPEDGGE